MLAVAFVQFSGNVITSAWMGFLANEKTIDSLVMGSSVQPLTSQYLSESVDCPSSWDLGWDITFSYNGSRCDIISSSQASWAHLNFFRFRKQSFPLWALPSLSCQPQWGEPFLPYSLPCFPLTFLCPLLRTVYSLSHGFPDGFPPI